MKPPGDPDAGSGSVRALADGADAQQPSIRTVRVDAQVGTGEAQQAARRAMARLRPEILRQAEYARRSGRSQVTVQLEPPRLGRLKLVVAEEDGKLNVHIRVENPEFRAALRTELPRLERALRQGQDWTGHADVSDFESSDSGRQAGAKANGARRVTGSGEGTTEGYPGGERGTWALFGAHRELDCLV